MIPFQINHKPDKSSVFGSLTWLVNVIERPPRNWKCSPGSRIRATAYEKTTEYVRAPCLRATRSLARLDCSSASLPLEIPYSSKSREESTYGQEVSQSGSSHYSQPHLLPLSLLLISALCPLSYHERLAHLWCPRLVSLSKPAHALPSTVFLCRISDWLFPVHFDPVWQ